MSRCLVQRFLMSMDPETNQLFEQVATVVAASQGSYGAQHMLARSTHDAAHIQLLGITAYSGKAIAVDECFQLHAIRVPVQVTYDKWQVDKKEARSSKMVACDGWILCCRAAVLLEFAGRRISTTEDRKSVESRWLEAAGSDMRGLKRVRFAEILRQELFQEDELEQRKQEQQQPKNKVKAQPSVLRVEGGAATSMSCPESRGCSQRDLQYRRSHRWSYGWAWSLAT